MILTWQYLDSQQRAACQATIAFLEKRMTDPATITWALGLIPSQQVERLAIVAVLNSPAAAGLTEPWLKAWRLIEESWASSNDEMINGGTFYTVSERLRAGDRSGSLISILVNLVAPRLKVEPRDGWRRQLATKPRRPKHFDDLLLPSLTSGPLVDYGQSALASVVDVHFLVALANGLEGAVTSGLDLARRLGWDGRGKLWRLGDLERVYYDNTIGGIRGGRDRRF